MFRRIVRLFATVALTVTAVYLSWGWLSFSSTFIFCGAIMVAAWTALSVPVNRHHRAWWRGQ
jgi:hypothetical protein